jgi:hypothetical protein
MTIDPDAPADKPETQQMKVIHRAMRREFARLPGLVAAVPAGDTARARLLGGHLGLVLGMLHEHHEAEDDLLWPLLVQRAPLQKDLVGLMEKQHRAIADAVGAVTEQTPVWTAHAGADARDRLAAALRDLEPALTEHLDLEESAVLPLVHEHLTVPEWRAPQQHAMRHGPKSVGDKLNLAGIVLQDATPREQAWFLGQMPAPARLLWRLAGARRYTRYAAQLEADTPR